MSDEEERREEHEAAVDELVDGLGDYGFELTSRLVVDLGSALRTRVEILDTRPGGLPHLAVGRVVAGATRFSVRSVVVRVRVLAAEDFLPSLRRSVASGYPRPFATNAEYARLLDLLRSVDPGVLDDLPSLSHLGDGVDLALGGGEGPRRGVAIATAVLGDVAAGVPLEWAVRRAEEAS